jgi:hypothetical protein
MPLAEAFAFVGEDTHVVRWQKGEKAGHVFASQIIRSVIHKRAAERLVAGLKLSLVTAHEKSGGNRD